MKRKWIEAGKNLLVVFNNYLAVLAACIWVMGLFKQDEPLVWLWSMFLIVPYAFYLMRIKLQNFFLFFAMHIALPAGALFLPTDVLPKILLMFICIFYAIWSIRIRINNRGYGESVMPPIFMTFVLGGMLLVEKGYSQRGWESVYIAIAIIYAAGYSMYLFADNYLRFVSVNESSAANIPEKEIFKNGFSQSFLYTSLLVVFLALTAKIDTLSYVTSRIGDLLLKLLKFLLSKAPSPEEQAIATVPTEQFLPDMELLPGPAEPSIISEIINQIFRIAGTLLVAFVITVTVVKGFQYLWTGFHKKYVKKETEEETGIDIRESCAIERKKKEEMHRFSFLGNRDKVRKLYRKHILKNQTVILGDLDAHNLEYKTAKECCDKLSSESLKKIYEKVRYSAAEITAEDVRAAKNDMR